MHSRFNFLMLSFLLSLLSSGSAAADDWGGFNRYSRENREIKNNSQKTPEVIFMGNSITELWAGEDPQFFDENNYLGRGISGQTTYQMLLRFRPDVIELQPEAVVICGGINDIAENNHSYNEDITFGNIVSMAQLAEANGIKVYLASLLPADKIYWNDNIKEIPAKIESLNNRLKKYAREEGYVYIDYYSSLTNESGGLDSRFSKDGVHPDKNGYIKMKEIILPILKGSLSGSQ